jgi:hypothetical protein
LYKQLTTFTVVFGDGVQAVPPSPGFQSNRIVGHSRPVKRETAHESTIETHTTNLKLDPPGRRSNIFQHIIVPRRLSLRRHYWGASWAARYGESEGSSRTAVADRDGHRVRERCGTLSICRAAENGGCKKINLHADNYGMIL